MRVMIPWKKSLSLMNNKLTFRLQQRKSFLWRFAPGISVFIPFAYPNYINVTGYFSSACLVLPSILYVCGLTVWRGGPVYPGHL